LKILQTKKNTFQLISMIVITLASQLLALYKSRFTAMNFGATNYMDAYNFSLSIATFLFAFVTTGITTVIIPAYVKKCDKSVVNSFITIIYSIVYILSFLIIVFRRPISIILTDRDSNFIDIVSEFLIYVFLIQGITSFLAVTTAYYQCINRFNTPKIILFFINLFITIILISGIINDFNQYILLLLLGSVLNLIIDLSIVIKFGFRYRPEFKWKNKELKKLLIIFLPTVFSSGVYQLCSLVDTTLATNLGEGMSTILGYSSQILSMINTVIIGNLSVYIYPKIVKYVENKMNTKCFWDYSILFHCCVLLIVTGYFIIGLEGISFIFGGGKFLEKDVYLLYICSGIYIYGQQFNIIRDLVYRYFYANSETKTTFTNSLIASFSNIVISILLISFLGIIGIVIGTVLSSLISLIMIIIRFYNRFGFDINFKPILFEWFKNNVVMILTIIIVTFIKSKFIISNGIAIIMVYGLLTIVVFTCLLKIFRSKIWSIRIE